MQKRTYDLIKDCLKTYRKTLPVLASLWFLSHGPAMIQGDHLNHRELIPDYRVETVALQVVK